MPATSDKKYTNLFDTSEIKQEVNQRSVKSGVANLISQALTLAITLGRAAILARLLTPEDYGMFTMVVVIAGFAVIFKDLGLSTATIREKKITHAQVSNLFWINSVVGLASMAVVAGSAPLVAAFYDDPRLEAIALALSVSFLFAGLSVQHQALLKRQMLFGKIAWITICSNLATSILGIFIAWSGYEYWALVGMNISQNLFMMLGFWYCTQWIPGRPSRKTGTKKFLKIGFDVAGLNAFSTLTQSFDKVIAGRIAGATNLGLYNKGGQVPDLVSGSFRMAFFSVALPALSSLQNERKQFATYYYRFLSSVCWLTMALSIFCFIYTEEIINVYFGAQWTGAVAYMRIFSIQAFLMPAITTLDQIPLVLGFSRRYLAGGIIRSIGTIICVSIGAITYGINGVAFGIVLANIITFIPFSKVCIKNSSITLSQYLQTALVPLLTTIVVGAVFLSVKIFYPISSIPFQLLNMTLCMLTLIAVFLICDYFNIGCNLGASKKILAKLRR
jgi:O-antigen/teichoic acid export membrane protein